MAQFAVDDVEAEYERLTRKGVNHPLTDIGQEMIAAAEGLRTFDRPVLVAWAADDRVMPPEHGHRLADLLRRGRLVEIPDSFTLIPEDQPGRLAEAIGEFVRIARVGPGPATRVAELIRHPEEVRDVHAGGEGANVPGPPRR